ncbi:hypothetical protein [Foetidibacter luteolus]|nr:hypothetical protein [Foetidibacter luteolus]
MIKDLFYDKEVVNTLKETEINQAILYTHLLSGRITMKEYLSICKS